MSDIAFTLSKLNFVSSRVVYCFMVLSMPVLTPKRLFVLSKTKMLLLKYVGLFKNPFLTHM
ncbi:hypothetical protein AB205_0173420 [Aquarana catesbeiana]|uniref:Uncharacterized protein n=1 Tax=Aquarana catesbeiana TaxID=8400 RepID=A0A2G9RSU8_AQUCT|nr:hypothetical protein AB205_0173420 [Aquarana catesbeiana]